MFRKGSSGDAESRNHNDQVDLDVASDFGGGGSEKLREPTTGAGVSPDLNAIWNELMGLKDLAENEHDRKLRRIESDLRWTMMLVAAQFVTLIGSAIGVLVGG